MATRIRTRSVPEKVPGAKFKLQHKKSPTSSGWKTLRVYPTFYTTHKWERMEDEPDTQARNKFVDHEVHRWKLNEPSKWVGPWMKGSDAVEFRKTLHSRPVTETLKLSLPAAHEAWDIPQWETSPEDFAEKFLHDAQYEYPADVDLPNFLLELSDAKRVAETLSSLSSKGYRSFSDIFEPKKVKRRRGRKTPYQSTTRSGREAHFTVEFGIEPVINDVLGLLDTKARFEKRMEWIKRRNGKGPTTVRRWQRRVGQVIGPVNTGFLDNGFYTQFAPGRYEELMVVGAQLRIDLQLYDDVLSKLGAGLHHLGFNRPASVLWEAIPFSWLIDYAVDISGLLKRFNQTQLSPGSWELIGGWVSTKAQWDWFQHRRYSNSGNTVFDGRTAHIQCSHYQRTPGLSTSNGLHLKSSALNKDQLMNILQLFN